MNKKSNIEIIPAILPKDFFEIEEKIGLVKDLVDFVQIDICDGSFVPNMTWPYVGDKGEFEKIIHEDEGMPGWQDLDFEIDLMVNNPEKVIDDWVTVGASRVVLHAESKGDVGKAIEMLKGRVETGMALNVDTPIDVIGDPKFGVKEGSLQFIQLMGIDHVGFQGQEFDAKVIDKIKQVKKMCPDYPVSIDGGVSLDNAKRLIDAGADRLVVGSAIFGSGDVKEAVGGFDRI